jgi:hypothetical protein
MNLNLIFFLLILFLLISLYINKSSFYESFVSIGINTDNVNDKYRIETEEDFLEIAKVIQDEIDINFPGVKITSYNLIHDWGKNIRPSNYFRYVFNKDLFDYKKNKKYTWDQETLDLYKEFYKSKGYNLSDPNYDSYTTKLRKIYSQSMIIELLTKETDFGNVYKDGLLFEYDLDKMTHKLVNSYTKGDPIKTNQYTISCQSIAKNVGPVFGDSSLDAHKIPDNLEKLLRIPADNIPRCNFCSKKTKCGGDMKFGSSVDKKIWKKHYMIYNPD